MDFCIIYQALHLPFSCGGHGGSGWTVTAPGVTGGHACETAEAQQDSGLTGGDLVCRAAAVWAPSNPLKAKVDGWLEALALVKLT